MNIKKNVIITLLFSNLIFNFGKKSNADLMLLKRHLNKKEKEGKIK